MKSLLNRIILKSFIFLLIIYLSFLFRNYSITLANFKNKVSKGIYISISKIIDLLITTFLLWMTFIIPYPCYFYSLGFLSLYIVNGIFLVFMILRLILNISSPERHSSYELKFIEKRLKISLRIIEIKKHRSQRKSLGIDRLLEHFNYERTVQYSMSKETEMTQRIKINKPGLYKNRYLQLYIFLLFNHNRYSISFYDFNSISIFTKNHVLLNLKTDNNSITILKWLNKCFKKLKSRRSLQYDLIMLLKSLGDLIKDSVKNRLDYAGLPNLSLFLMISE